MNDRSIINYMLKGFRLRRPETFEKVVERGLLPDLKAEIQLCILEGHDLKTISSKAGRLFAHLSKCRPWSVLLGGVQY